MEPSYEPFASLAVALAVGLLIGLEREQAAPDSERKDGLFAGGVRTHPLFALCGAVAMLVSLQAGVWFVAIVFVGFTAFLVAAYWVDVKVHNERGMTSEAAFLFSFLLGTLALTRGVIEPVSRKLIVVASLAVIATLLLSSKRFLHRLVEKVSREDLFATLKFLIVTVVVLPLLPNATYGPLSVLNPFNIGLMIVLIAGIGFTGYVAIRILGSGRGLALTGLVGGLVSSTAVTLSFSGKARAEPAMAPGCALAVVLASAIMYGRVLVEVAVVYPALVRPLAVPMGAMLVAGLGVTLVFYRRAKGGTKEGAEVKFSNPFELSSAIKFGLLFALVLLASKAASVYFGSAGTYLAGLLAGTTDVDAITLSMANLARGGLDPNVAVTTIIIGAASNTVVKGGMAVVLGGRAFGRQIALAFGFMLAAGGLGVASIWLT